MKIQISGQHIEVTQAIKDHIKKKFEKIEKHFEHLVNVHIVLKVEKKQHVAEATVHVSRHDFATTTYSEDMYTTINMLVDKLDRQIVKHKGKIQVHH